MRIVWGVLALLLALAGCAGGHRRPATPPPSRADQERALRLCLGNLGQAGVRYTRLPDRSFKGGCTAIGTVQLLDVGMPVTNLGAMTCRLALPFSSWAGDAVQAAAKAWLDSPVVKIESFGTYSCRPVNGVEGGKLSEHGRSNAVDISGFILANGRRITVLEGWNGTDQNVRNFLRAVHNAACRRFAVVLGPDANGYHRNHFHFDMATNGPYCR